LQVQEERIAAVIGASDAPQSAQPTSALRFPLRPPQDYFMLSVDPDPNSPVDPVQVRLSRDQLVTSNAVLGAFRTNRPGAARMLAGSAMPGGSRAETEWIWGLTRINTPGTTGRLRSLLAREGLCQPLVIRELGRRRDRRSAPALMKMLSSGNDIVRAACARALGDIEHRAALPALKDALKHGDDFSKRDIAEAIVRMEGDRAALELFGSSADWGSAARRYLYYPLARCGAEGERIVLDELARSLPNGIDARFAVRALLASGRTGAVLGLARMLAGKKDLFRGEGNGTYITVSLVPVLAER
jgi:hypothetical protein